MGQNNSLIGASNANDAVLQNFIQEQWQIIIPQRPIKKQYGVVQTLRNQHTGQLIQKYELLFESEKDVKTYLESFIYRLKEQFIVNTLYIQKHSQGFCNHNQKISVYLPAIVLRLEQICELPFPFSMCLLRSCIIGYHKLYESIGYFDVEENQVCIDDSGSVKVWVNKNLSLNTPYILQGHVRLNYLPKKDTKRTDLTQKPSQKKQYIRYDKNQNWMVINVLQMILKCFEYGSEPNRFIDQLQARIQSAKSKSTIQSKKRMMIESQSSINSISKNCKHQPLTFEEIFDIMNQFSISCSVEIPENLSYILQLLGKRNKTEVASLIGTKKSQIENMSINEFSRSYGGPLTNKTHRSYKSSKHLAKQQSNISQLPNIDTHLKTDDLRLSQISGSESQRKIKTSLKQKLSKTSSNACSSSDKKQKICLNDLFKPLKKNSIHKQLHYSSASYKKKGDHLHNASQVQFQQSYNASESSFNNISRTQSMAKKFSIPIIKQTSKPSSENVFSFQDSTYKFKSRNQQQSNRQYLSMNNAPKNYTSSKSQIYPKIDCWTMTENFLSSLQEFSTKQNTNFKNSLSNNHSYSNYQVQINGVGNQMHAMYRQKVQQDSKLNDSLLFGNKNGLANGYSLRQDTQQNILHHRSQDSNTPSGNTSLKNSLYSHQNEKQYILEKYFSNQSMLPQIQQIQQTRKTGEGYQSQKNQSFQYSHTSQAKQSQINNQLNASKSSNVHLQKKSLVQNNHQVIPSKPNHSQLNKPINDQCSQKQIQNTNKQNQPSQISFTNKDNYIVINEGTNTKRSSEDQQLESLYSANHNIKPRFDCRSQANSSVIFDKLSQVSRHIDFGLSQNTKLITPSQISMILDKKFCNDLDQYASAVNNQSYEDGSAQQHSIVQNTDSLFNLKKRFKKKMFCCESGAGNDSQMPNNFSATFATQNKFKKGTSDSSKGLVTSLDLKHNKKPSNLTLYNEQIPQIDQNMQDSKHTFTNKKNEQENRVGPSSSQMSLNSQNLAVQLGQRANENDLTVPCVELEQIVNGMKKQQNRQNRYKGPGPMDIDQSIIEDLLKQGNLDKHCEDEIKRSILGIHNRSSHISKNSQRN